MVTVLTVETGRPMASWASLTSSFWYSIVFSTNFSNLSKVKSRAEVTRLEKTLVPWANEAVKMSVKFVIEAEVADKSFINTVTSSGVLPSANAK